MSIYGKTLILCCFVFLFGCTQEPARIINKVSSVYSKNKKISSNPFKVSVQNGDNLYSISKKYGVGIRDLIELNRLRPPYSLTVGQIIKLPQATFHVIKEGDTIYAISRSYGVDISRLVHLNNLKAPYTITAGKKMRLPSATSYSDSGEDESIAVSSGENLRQVMTKDLGLLNEPPEKPTFILPKKVKTDPNAPYPALRASTYPAPTFKPGTKHAKAQNTPPQKPKITRFSKAGFLWPVKGKIISRFGPKKGGLYNDGINISAPKNTSIIAADNGRVVYSGNELRGYGNLILLKHDNGYLTAYAHTSKISVRKGDVVEKGQTIAYVGDTGHVSSPQLHFSIRKGRKALDPQKYLPGTISMN